MRFHVSPMTSIARRFRVVPWAQRGELFHLEMSSRHRAYLAPVRAGLMGLCVILAVFIAGTVIRTAGLYSERQNMQARLIQIHEHDRQLITLAQQEGIDMSPASLQRVAAEVGLANQLLAKRNFSWTRFLSGLEEAIPSRVAIKSVRLDPVSAVIHLTGAAITVEDVTALALKLQNHPVFRDPVLGQHHTGGDGLVEFDLALKYHPNGT